MQAHGGNKGAELCDCLGHVRRYSYYFAVQSLRACVCMRVCVSVCLFVCVCVHAWLGAAAEGTLPRHSVGVG